VLQHRNEFHFLAHFHYPLAYEELVAGAQTNVESVRFEWLAANSADVVFSLR
jgi:hypothetical protein